MTPSRGHQSKNMARLFCFAVTFVVTCYLGIAACDVADHAETMCKAPEKSQMNGEQITGISNMLNLIEYFEQLPTNHDLSDCRDKYIGSMSLLKKVLTTGNDNACGDEKVTQIENFNKKYISTALNDFEMQRKENLKAPKVIRRFFMHYGFKINSICKESFMDKVEKDQVFFSDVYGNRANSTSLSELSKGFQDIFKIDLKKHGYKDLISPWKMVDSFPVKKKDMKFLHGAFVENGSHLTRSPARLSIRVKDGENVESIKDTCRELLEPQYSDLGLPILRLTSLGLYEEGDVLSKRLATDENLRRYFGVIQVCETFLPIEIFEDKSLKSGKIVAITTDMAVEMRANTPVKKHSVDSDQPSLPEQVPVVLPIVGLDELESLADANSAKKLARTIESNRESQEGMFKRLMSMSSSAMKTQIKSKASRIFSLSSHSGNQVVGELEVEGVPESSGELERTKRSLFDVFFPLMVVIYAIGAVIYWIIYGTALGVIYTVCFIKYGYYCNHPRPKN